MRLELTDLGCCSVPDVGQLSGGDDVVEHQDVRLAVDLLHLCRAQSEPDLTPAGLVATPEDVRQPGPELLAATESSEVPAVVTGLQQTQLGPVGRHPGPGSQHPGLDQLGSLLLQPEFSSPCHG